MKSRVLRSPCRDPMVVISIVTSSRSHSRALVTRPPRWAIRTNTAAAREYDRQYGADTAVMAANTTTTEARAWKRIPLMLHFGAGD